MKIKIKILDKEISLEEAKELYLELHELFGKEHITSPLPWNPYPITYGDMKPLPPAFSKTVDDNFFELG